MNPESQTIDPDLVTPLNAAINHLLTEELDLADKYFSQFISKQKLIRMPDDRTFTKAKSQLDTAGNKLHIITERTPPEVVAKIFKQWFDAAEMWMLFVELWIDGVSARRISNEPTA